MVMRAKILKTTCALLALSCAVPIPSYADLPSEYQELSEPEVAQAEWKNLISLLVQQKVMPSNHAGFLVEYMAVTHRDEYQAVRDNEVEAIEAAKRYRDELFQDVSPKMTFSAPLKMGRYNFSDKSFALGWDKKELFVSYNDKPLNIGFNRGPKYIPGYIPYRLLGGVPKAWRSLRIEKDSAGRLIELLDNRNRVYVSMVGWVSGYVNDTAIVVPESLWIYTSEEKERLIAAIDVAGIPLEMEHSEISEGVSKKAYQIIAQDDGGLGLDNAIVIGANEDSEFEVSDDDGLEDDKPIEENNDQESYEEDWGSVSDEDLSGSSEFSIISPDGSEIESSKLWIKNVALMNKKYAFTGGGCPLTVELKSSKNDKAAHNLLKQKLASEEGCQNLDSYAAFQLVQSIDDGEVRPWEIVIPNMKPIENYRRLTNFFKRLSDKEIHMVVQKLIREDKLQKPMDFLDLASFIINNGSQNRAAETLKVLLPHLEGKATIDDFKKINDQIRSKRAFYTAISEFDIIDNKITFDDFISLLEMSDPETHRYIIKGALPKSLKLSGDHLVTIVQVSNGQSVIRLMNFFKDMAKDNRFAGGLSLEKLNEVIEPIDVGGRIDVAEVLIPYLAKNQKLSAVIPVIEGFDDERDRSSFIKDAIKEGALRVVSADDLDVLESALSSKSLDRLKKGIK